MASDPHYQPSFGGMKIDPNSELGKQMDETMKADIARQEAIDQAGLGADHHLTDSDILDFMR